MSDLSSEIEQYIQAELATGAYQDRDELIEKALRLWKRHQEDRAFITREVNKGIEQAQRGEHDDLDMDAIVEEVKAQLDAEGFTT